MSLRQSFSGFRKKVKVKLSKIGNRTGRRGTDVGGESAHSSPPLQSGPAIVAESEARGDIRVGIGEDDPQPEDSQSISRSIIERECEPGGSDSHANRREDIQGGLHPHKNVQAGHGDIDERKGGQVDPPRSQSDIKDGTTPTPSISQGGGSEST